jgi:hypothetical protein
MFVPLPEPDDSLKSGGVFESDRDGCFVLSLALFVLLVVLAFLVSRAPCGVVACYC